MSPHPTCLRGGLLPVFASCMCEKKCTRLERKGLLFLNIEETGDISIQREREIRRGAFGWQGVEMGACELVEGVDLSVLPLTVV